MHPLLSLCPLTASVRSGRRPRASAAWSRARAWPTSGATTTNSFGGRTISSMIGRTPTSILITLPSMSQLATRPGREMDNL